MNTLINADCMKALYPHEKVQCIFADPPDNIGLGYDEFDDNKDNPEYVRWLEELLGLLIVRADTVWFSFNAKWTFEVGRIFQSLIYRFASSKRKLEGKPCVQVFTFGQHRKTDLGNNHRPLWRLKWDDAPLYPDQIKVPSWRQRNGDKRAAPGGKVPGDVFDMQYPDGGNAQDRIGRWLSAAADDPSSCAEFKADIEAWFETCNGDVFDFPRVTGNSAQRQDWCPTQLHEALVERCILLSTDMGDSVVDPYMGSGTTLRVCLRNARLCTTIDTDATYCNIAAQQNGLRQTGPVTWVRA